MKATITKLHKVEPDAFNGLTRTEFDYKSGDETNRAYIFTKPENAPGVGDILEGEIKQDRGGRNKFTKDKGQEGFPRPSAAAAAKTFKADPAKMKQEFTLEVARNLSIQRQVAVKGVVDLICAGKRDYADLVVTFDDLMELLNRREAQVKHDDNEPPFTDDEVPTEEEVSGDIDLEGIEL